MPCAYCNNTAAPVDGNCAGCGAPRTAPKVNPWGTQDNVYEQIGRAVMRRDASSGNLERILGVGERQTASDPEKIAARVTKVVLVLIFMWQFPLLLVPLLSMGFMLFFWYTLLNRGFKALWNWIMD